MKLSWRTAADVLTTGAILVTCASLIWSNKARPKTGPSLPTVPLSIEGATVRGSSTARVVIIEWSDYECPFCGQVERELSPKLDERYVQPGKVQLAFRHLPLEQIHRRAVAAAQAALCAGADGRFWEMHSALFAAPTRLDDESLLERARELRIDEPRFKACVSGPRDSRITKDLEAARGLGLTGTPVFLIGLRRSDQKVDVLKILSGVRPIAEFVDVVEPLLVKTRSGSGSVTYLGSGAGLLILGSAALWRWSRHRPDSVLRKTPK